MLSAILFALAQAPVADPKPIEWLPPLVQLAQAVSPDHKRMAIATREKGVWVLDLPSGNVVSKIAANGSTFGSFAWSADGRRLAMRHTSSLLQVAKVDDGGLILSVSVVSCSSREIRFAAGDRVIVAAIGNEAGQVISSTDGKLIASMNLSAGHKITALALSRDSETIALGDDAGTVALWKARTGERIEGGVTVPPGKSQRDVYSLDFDASGRSLAIGSADCIARIWQCGSSLPPSEFSHCDENLSGSLAIGWVRFSSDGSRLLSTSFGFWEIRVWDVVSGKMLVRYDYGGGSPREMRAWFTGGDVHFVASLGCRVAPATIQIPLRGSLPSSGEHPIPGARPEFGDADYAFFCSDGEYAWAVIDCHLVVRKIPDEQPILKIPVLDK